MKSSFWKNKNVLVTGGAGFIGSHVVEQLVGQGARVTVFDNLKFGSMEHLSGVAGDITFIEGDCTDLKDAQEACSSQEIVMNLAARVGGIEYNRTHQATMMHDNLKIAAVMMDAAQKAHVQRFLVVSSACVYPHDAIVPTPESEGFRDEPEETNGGYGWAKRMAEKLGMYFAQEWGMEVSIVRPYNAYGPRDHFDPNTSHVIPALIKRVLSGENPVTVWGSGRQTRAFLYVDDLARGMILATEKYSRATPVNLGTDEEVTIQYLIETIVNITGRKCRIVFDTTKPDGSPRRSSDNTLARDVLGFVAGTRLEEGLKNAISWFITHSHHA